MQDLIDISCCSSSHCHFLLQDKVILCDTHECLTSMCLANMFELLFPVRVLLCYEQSNLVES